MTVRQTRARFGWKDGEQVVLHAGNIGLKQGLEQVIEAARIAADRHEFVRFVLSGGGSQAAAIQAAAGGLPNVDFLGFQPDGIHASLLDAADVLLLSERATQIDMSLPSKLTAYFAAGRPVVAAVPRRRVRTRGAPIRRRRRRPRRRAGTAFRGDRTTTDGADVGGRAGSRRTRLCGGQHLGGDVPCPCDGLRRYDRGMTPEPQRKALITGITGQDGSYLAELLLDKGYEVHGLIRRSSSFNTGRIDHLYRDPHESATRLFLHYGDLTDSSSLIGHLHRIKPAEVYNLGAQSHVKVSFEMPEFTAETAAMGTLRMLEAVRTADWPIRFYQAGSSEQYGKVLETPQRESTPFNPRSPYAVAKVFAHFITVDYREAYGLHASNGILFNHESPRRGGTFVTRKVTRGVAGILAGTQEHLFLGNLDAHRDWGYAKEYVEAMWLMLQQSEPDDYVIATGQMHSVRELCEVAFGLVGLDWEQHVRVDEKYFRPTEVEELRGDASRARERLGWEPRTTFRELVRLMLEHDLVNAGVDMLNRLRVS